MNRFLRVSFIKLSIIPAILMVLAGCSSSVEKKADYPSNPKEQRREKLGKLSGDGIVFFGKKKGEESSKGGANVGIGINSYLWRSTLETLSFMPLMSADPFGGVIITDWYEEPKSRGERFKVNVVITDTRLNVNALNVSVFKQIYTKNYGWRDAKPSKKVAVDLESSILTRARTLRIEKESSN